MSTGSTTLANRLSEFRSTYSVAELEHRGVAWKYWRGGPAGEPVLWLTGALGVGEFAFAHILGLEADFKVVIPDYPPVPSLDVIVDGLVAVLDAEGICAAHVVGGSFGGMVAQHLVRRHPERVSSLVLSHSPAPDPSYIRPAVIRVLSLLLPEGVYRALFIRRLRGIFVAADPFWADYFDSTVARLTKADLVSRVTLANEFLQFDYGPGDVEAWAGRVLIVDSDDDPALNPGAPIVLRQLYPAAETHTFHGMGHSAPILQPERHAEVIRHFWRSGSV